MWFNVQLFCGCLLENDWNGWSLWHAQNGFQAVLQSKLSIIPIFTALDAQILLPLDNFGWSQIPSHSLKGLEKNWFWLAISFRNLPPWIVTTSIFCVFRSFITCQLARDQFWIEHLSPNIWPIIPRAMNWKVAWCLRDRWIFVAKKKHAAKQLQVSYECKKTQKNLP